MTNPSALSSFPRLRLFQDEAPPPVAKPLVTLREIWEQQVAPDLPHDTAKKTREGYLDVLSHWEALTDNAPTHRINRELLRDFQRKLLQGKHARRKGQIRSVATVNKLLRTIRPLIARCWPRDSHNPDGLGLCDYFRFPAAVKWQRKIPRVLSEEEITALFLAADAPTWRTRGETRLMGDLWRAAIICGYNCGPRTFDLLAWERAKLDWTLQREGCVGTIQFYSTKTRKIQRLPLNPTTAAALRKILPASLAATRPGIWQGWSRSNGSQVRLNWQKLCTAAGVDCVMEDLRKTCNTRHQTNRHGVGPWVLGHNANGVNATNYYDPTDDILQAMASLPQPQCFLDWVG